MRSYTISVVSFGLIALTGLSALAGPSLPVTKPPVEPADAWTGPINDPFATEGQWFLDLEDLSTDVSSHEFYDNVVGAGGGSMGHLAISGYVSSANVVQFNLPQPPYVGFLIDSFDILATITNDTPATSDWEEGSNSHQEWPLQREQYAGTLFDAKLTAEFAVDLDALLAWDPDGTKRTLDPYNDVAPQIKATNHDELAWYCWTPDNEDQREPYGDFLVPTWDFGDIAPGESVTRTLSFECIVEDGTPLYTLLTESRNFQSDIFANRTTSLKISDWLDSLVFDTGVAYPDSPLGGSNVSVFHVVPEPSTLVMLLGMGLVGLAFGARRFRRR